jgi:hypothetical protein
MEADQAGRATESWLFETWAARERARFTLPPSLLALQPGDLVSIEHAARSQLFRIVEVGEHGARDIEAAGADPSVYAAGRGTVRPSTASIADNAGPVLGVLLDLPMLGDNEPEMGGYVIAARDPWAKGGAAFYRSAEEANFTLASVAERNGTTGVTLSPLQPGCEARLNLGTRLRVELDTGMLLSTTRLNLLGGANAAAIEAADGTWEIVQFETASLVAPRTYDLAGVLRGQLGTEPATRTPLAPGARFVLLDGALARLPLTLADVGSPFFWRYGPAQRALGDAAYRTVGHVFRGTGLRPLSPVHVRGRRSGGDLILTWIRRTRIGGDSWEAIEVPLGEDAERYEVEILSGETVVRRLSTELPTVTYSAAEQVADFGAAQSSLAVRVAQVSAVLGRGTPRDAVV